ncbi:hypothetical protein QUA41_10195 [Microcoleus sp. Pol11C1]
MSTRFPIFHSGYTHVQFIRNLLLRQLAAYAGLTQARSHFLNFS